MKKIFVFLSLFASCVFAEQKCQKERPITIAVVDTGFGYGEHGQTKKLCKYGHKDFIRFSYNFYENFLYKTKHFIS